MSKTATENTDVTEEVKEVQEEETTEEKTEIVLSPLAERYAAYYRKGFWTKKMLRNVVPKKISEEEYEAITGEKYA